MPKAKQEGSEEAQGANAVVQAQANGSPRPRLVAKGAPKPVSSTRRASGKAAGSAKAGSARASSDEGAGQHGAREVATDDQAGAQPSGGKRADVTSTEARAVTAVAPGAPPSSSKTRARRASGHHEGHAATASTAAPSAGEDEERAIFLAHQRELLVAERNNYTRQAEELRAEAEALALEHEPGDVQFDEEGGEGGTVSVDRELDLHLSAQAHAAIEEIDAALAKIAAGTYGFCESCGRPIPTARLEALPHARLCVSCKSGGLSALRQ